VNFRERLGALQTRIDELTLRERGILFLVIVALLYVAIDSLLIAPQEQTQKRLLSDIGKIRADITQLEQQKLEIINNHSVDPNAVEQRRLQQLNTAMQKIEGQIKEAVNGLIEPQEMARALESVLKKQQQLGFVRIENLGSKPLLNVEPTEGKVSDAGIYIHTMRIELEGSFYHTRDYLQALEQLPWRFHWESVELAIIDYPLARVVITVNTLSLNEGWIGV
jgi:MSHA biogenesis protein MshJ